jgi:ADP-heptose:LPS heptosyltransferase
MNIKKSLLIFVKIGNLINFLINSLIIKIIHLKKRPIKEKTLLIIKLDSIGDYILVQNFFSILRTDSFYRNFKITLCGNIIWKDLAEYCSINTFDEFIWINRKKFRWNLIYKFNIYNKIYLKGYEVAIETIFSREILFGDTIIKASKAKERIGSTGSPENKGKWKRKLFTDNYYTKLITQKEENLFEFYRNKEFFERLLKKKIDITKAVLNFNSVQLNLPLMKDYILIVPGAQEKVRRWSYKKFAELIKLLLEAYQYNILLVGSPSEKEITNNIFNEIKSNRVQDYVGKTNLPEFGKIISEAKLLISNDTSAIHFAAALNISFICISNGKHLGRFNPYPDEMNLKCIFIYPDKLEQRIYSNNVNYDEFRTSSNYNINEISTEKVFSAVKKILEAN